MAKKKIMYGHWESIVGEFVPTDYLGFLYLVYCKATKKFYIGKKQFISVSHKKIVGKTRRQKITKESDWLTYQTSSQYVKADIAEHGAESFQWFIIGVFKTKSGLRYAETNSLHKFDTNVDNGGRSWYNLAIDGVRFVVKEFDPLIGKRIAKLIKELT